MKIDKLETAKLMGGKTRKKTKKNLEKSCKLQKFHEIMQAMQTKN